MSLSDKHYTHLHEGSGISKEVIEARGYKTIEKMTELKEYGFSPEQCKAAPGLLLPLHATDGSNGLYIFKPDMPRVFHKKNGEPKALKYEMPKGAGLRIDCPPSCRPKLDNPQIPLWITEGQKKADAMASHELCAVALLGVYGYKGKNEFGATTFLADWDHIGFKGRDVNIVYDSDVMTSLSV